VQGAYYAWLKPPFKAGIGIGVFPHVRISLTDDDHAKVRAKKP
tara:strand:+ start:600 stop:728 length:129 start_codon:yes stop_codon:yes gene_type:complete